MLKASYRNRNLINKKIKRLLELFLKHRWHVRTCEFPKHF